MLSLNKQQQMTTEEHVGKHHPELGLVTYQEKEHTWAQINNT